MDRATLLQFIADDLHVSVFVVLLLERKGDPRIEEATARILSWEETGIRFEKPLTPERRPLTFDMLGKPKNARKRKAKPKNPNKVWMGRSY